MMNKNLNEEQTRQLEMGKMTATALDDVCLIDEGPLVSIGLRGGEGGLIRR
jgi:hypothetical protein